MRRLGPAWRTGARHRQFSVSAGQRLGVLFVICTAWAEEDQIRQSQRLPGLSVAREIHKNSFRLVSRLENEAVLCGKPRRHSRVFPSIASGD
jgi:hypothetical protein